MENDEMMSQDTAFGTENNEKKEDLFKFDEPKETTDANASNPDSQPKVEIGASQDNGDTSEEDSSTEEDVQKVPYTRFKKKLDELNDTTSRVKMLEEELIKLREAKVETPEDIEPDEAWKELYGDNDVARKAYKIQLQRDSEIEERAIEKAIERINQREEQQIKALSENESIIDSNLENLEEKVGKKLTAKQEEEILSIVDEFSPTGDDGKYITLFPFDKAYEIYQLRTSSKIRPTQKARESIADLTGNTSEGEIDSNSSNFKSQKWDSWEDEI